MNPFQFFLEGGGGEGGEASNPGRLLWLQFWNVYMEIILDHVLREI